MEFIETPSFWCPHVDRAACTNFSTRTVELQPSEHQEILLFFPFPFPFIFLSFSPFLPFLRTPFSFLYEFFSFFASFFLFFPFFIFSFFFSSFILLIFSFSFISSQFLFSFGIFSSFFFIIDRLVKGGSFLPFSSCHLCGPQFSFLFLNSIISFCCTINHVANCEPHIQVHHMVLAMCHSLGVPCGIPITMPCVIRHHTPRKTCNSDCLGIRRNLTW